MFLHFFSPSFQAAPFSLDSTSAPTQIKAAVLRSGRSIEIVLNEQSKRKTPALVALDSNFSITAENVRNVDRRVGISALKVLTAESVRRDPPLPRTSSGSNHRTIFSLTSAPDFSISRWMGCS
jgi:hypothetical protein